MDSARVGLGKVDELAGSHLLLLRAFPDELGAGGADGTVLRHPDASTAAHAALLRGLVGWAAALDARVKELDVMEETQDGAGLWALVRVHEPDLEAVLSEHAVMRVPAPRGWSGYRAEGMLPTGHRLMISI